jgi:two-component system phosphate regulon sensor histidine kinase PhoR
MKKRFFPWRLYWNFFLSLLAFSAGLSLFSIFAFSLINHSDFLTESTLWAFLLVSVLSVGIAALLAYRFAAPLRRVILKALRMSNKQLYFQLSGVEVDEDSLFRSEPGEYFELEQALDQIRRKMKKRREQLAHEREESQTIMTSIEDGVVNISPEGNLIYFNSGFATHFLGREQIQMQQENKLALTQVLRDTEIIASVDRALKEGRGGTMIRSLPTLMTQHPRDFSVSVSPLRDPKTKEIYGALGLFHDVTQLKQAERIRMEFVENASHELRTPLTSVKGYLETFKEDFYAGRYDDAKVFLNVVTKNVDRLMTLVNDLLTISTLENGVSGEFEPIPLDRITSDVMDRLSGLAQEKNVMLHFQLRGATLLQGDYRRIEQVLENLIGNAIKYAHAGGRVDILWEADPDSSEAVTLKVKDYGLGISAEHQARIFERFYRVDKARSREVGGTGLGLAIVKHIVQAHGGTVGVKSSPGEGCEFWCHFPARAGSGY